VDDEGTGISEERDDDTKYYKHEQHSLKPGEVLCDALQHRDSHILSCLVVASLRRYTVEAGEEIITGCPIDISPVIASYCECPLPLAVCCLRIQCLYSP